MKKNFDKFKRKFRKKYQSKEKAIQKCKKIFKRDYL